MPLEEILGAFLFLYMKVLIDPPGADGWSHLVADTIPNLHAFAEKISVNRCWYSNKRNKRTGKSKNQPHYDLKGEQIQKAINSGAELVDQRVLFTFLKDTYGK